MKPNWRKSIKAPLPVTTMSGEECDRVVASPTRVAAPKNNAPSARPDEVRETWPKGDALVTETHCPATADTVSTCGGNTTAERQKCPANSQGHARSTQGDEGEGCMAARQCLGRPNCLAPATKVHGRGGNHGAASRTGAVNCYKRVLATEVSDDVHTSTEGRRPHCPAPADTVSTCGGIHGAASRTGASFSIGWRFPATADGNACHLKLGAVQRCSRRRFGGRFARCVRS